MAMQDAGYLDLILWIKLAEDNAHILLLYSFSLDQQPDHLQSLQNQDFHLFSLVVVHSNFGGCNAFKIAARIP